MWATDSQLKNAVLAFFNLAKCGAKLGTARKITTFVAILPSLPCDVAPRRILRQAVNRIPRFVCAGILLVAAGFKGYELVADPALGTLYGSRWLQLLLIEYEVLLASWLLSGVAQHACRWVALVTFATFGCYALYFGLTGAASCGCFGRAQVSPWWTFGLDGAALLLLWRWKTVQTVVCLRRVASFAALPAVVGVVLAVAVVMQPRAAVADGFVVGESFTLLDPEKWIGKPFPLNQYIDLGWQLADGRWTVVLYHHDCPKCRQVLPEYERLAGQRDSKSRATQVALIEIPPYDPVKSYKSTDCAHGRLNESKQWFIATPTEVTLDNGLIVAYESQPNRRFGLPE